MDSFLNLGLQKPIVDALQKLGYETPTGIQKQAIPQILNTNSDVKAFAQTGTGKTAAFSLPILELCDFEEQTVEALILSPTRELAVQIGKNIEDFSQFMPKVKVLTVYGGANIETQISALKKGVHVVVGTPGRTLDLLHRKALNLKNLKFLVLDEADEMLNMGFKEDLDAIINYTTKSQQTLLFSATFPKEVEEIAKAYLKNPIDISSGQVNTGTANVSHLFYKVTENTRYLVLKRVVDTYPDIYGIVFCRTRRDTQKIADQLIQDGYNADALHGDLSQSQRDAVMAKFRNKNIQLLVATDVAARGLDVTNLTHVINHKLPDQIENYTHRSGRTGRAGNTGISITLANRKEISKLKPLEKVLKQPFTEVEIPTGDEICKTQLMHWVHQIRDTQIDTSDLHSFLPEIYKTFDDVTKEELIQKVATYHFKQLLSYYQNIDNHVSSENDEKGYSTNADMTRFFINLGRKDKLKPAKLMGLINEQGIGHGVQIGAIDILETFSFFEIDKEYTQQTLDAFEKNQPDFGGRKVNVEVTKKEGGGNRTRGRRRDRDKSSDKSSKEFSKDRAPKFKFKKPDFKEKDFGKPKKSNSRDDKKPSGFGRKKRG